MRSRCNDSWWVFTWSIILFLGLMDFNLRFDWICCVPRVPMKSVCSFDWILLTIRHFVLRWPPSNLSYFSCSSKLITIIRWTTMCPLSVLYIWFDVFMLPAVISEESLLFFFLWLIFLSLFFPFFNRRGGSLFVWLSFFFGAADSSSGRWTTRRRCLKKKNQQKTNKIFYRSSRRINALLTTQWRRRPMAFEDQEEEEEEEEGVGGRRDASFSFVRTERAATRRRD